jgi:hypothetical protein
MGEMALRRSPISARKISAARYSGKDFLAARGAVC